MTSENKEPHTYNPPERFEEHWTADHEKRRDPLVVLSVCIIIAFFIWLAVAMVISSRIF